MSREDIENLDYWDNLEKANKAYNIKLTKLLYDLAKERYGLPETIPPLENEA